MKLKLVSNNVKNDDQSLPLLLGDVLPQIVSRSNAWIENLSDSLVSRARVHFSNGLQLSVIYIHFGRMIPPPPRAIMRLSGFEVAIIAPNSNMCDPVRCLSPQQVLQCVEYVEGLTWRDRPEFSEEFLQGLSDSDK